jgi:hypothetical protein
MSLLWNYAAATPYNSSYYTQVGYQQHIHIFPHDSAPAGAQLWSSTAAQSASAHRMSLLWYYATATP